MRKQVIQAFQAGLGVEYTYVFKLFGVLYSDIEFTTNQGSTIALVNDFSSIKYSQESESFIGSSSISIELSDQFGNFSRLLRERNIYNEQVVVYLAPLRNMNNLKAEPVQLITLFIGTVDLPIEYFPIERKLVIQVSEYYKEQTVCRRTSTDVLIPELFGTVKRFKVENLHKRINMEIKEEVVYSGEHTYDLKFDCDSELPIGEDVEIYLSGSSSTEFLFKITGQFTDEHTFHFDTNDLVWKLYRDLAVVDAYTENSKLVLQLSNAPYLVGLFLDLEINMPDYNFTYHGYAQVKEQSNNKLYLDMNFYIDNNTEILIKSAAKSYASAATLPVGTRISYSKSNKYVVAAGLVNIEQVFLEDNLFNGYSVTYEDDCTYVEILNLENAQISVTASNTLNTDLKAINYLTTKYGDFQTIDETVDKPRDVINMLINTEEELVKLITEILWQKGKALRHEFVGETMVARIIRLYGSYYEPCYTFDNNNINVEHFTLSHGRNIVNKITVTLRNNDHSTDLVEKKYELQSVLQNSKNLDIDYYAFNTIENMEFFIRDFWLNKLNNIPTELYFESFMDACQLEVFDQVNINITLPDYMSKDNSPYAKLPSSCDQNFTVSTVGTILEIQLLGEGLIKFRVSLS